MYVKTIRGTTFQICGLEGTALLYSLGKIKKYLVLGYLECTWRWHLWHLFRIVHRIKLLLCHRISFKNLLHAWIFFSSWHKKIYRFRYRGRLKASQRMNGIRDSSGINEDWPFMHVYGFYLLRAHINIVTRNRNGLAEPPC